MPRPRKQENKKMSARERAKGIARIAAITYKASPFAVLVKVAGTVITSVLPIITARRPYLCDAKWSGCRRGSS